jgi:plasmid stabilization system protein ParE
MRCSANTDEIFFHSEATDELDDSFRYYENEYPGRGYCFVQQVEACVRRICRYPELGTEELPGIRRMVVDRFPYKIIYMLHNETIVILAVAHAHRMPEYWKKRSDD